MRIQIWKLYRKEHNKNIPSGGMGQLSVVEEEMVVLKVRLSRRVNEIMY